ncbi:hypothetical protein J7382_16095 [Shimia sp. R11_0]|uniref:DUF6151 family protein n=1 Tax=Shimia sp. R11_0 TaxID=2821096 RepID=UPI001ADBCD48|nr:DUF6151 family protein [Shimia sp. R11_0]MBO9479070.1 hypothetical protein [Shimia sp. R11_0]
MTGTNVPLKCKCGAFEAVLNDVSPRTGSHIHCHCQDCQTAARVLGAEEQLLPRAGSDIFHTTPAQLTLTKGQEHLACLRLSPRGLMRWYAGCCNTPMFATMAHTKLAFMGVWVPSMAPPPETKLAKVIGKVIAVVRTQDAPMGSPSLKEYGFNRAGFHVLARHVSALLQGRARQTPLFDAEGAPIVKPRVLSKEERLAAQK